MTFDSVSIDLSNWVANGGTYVALSRCRKLSGIHIIRPLTISDIKIDKNVLKFAQTETPDTMLISKIEDGKIAKLYNECQLKFEINDASGMLKTYKEVSKMRDITDAVLFHKFIRVKLSLHHRYKRLFNIAKAECIKLQEELSNVQRDNVTILEKNKILETKLDEITDKLKLSNEDNHKLQQNQDKLNSDISIKSKEISVVQLNLDTANKDLNKQLINIINLQDKISELEREKHRLESTNSTLQNDNQNLSTTLNDTRKELHRANSITWLQKLFGKK